MQKITFNVNTSLEIDRYSRNGCGRKKNLENVEMKRVELNPGLNKASIENFYILSQLHINLLKTDTVTQHNSKQRKRKTQKTLVIQ